MGLDKPHGMLGATLRMSPMCLPAHVWGRQSNAFAAFLSLLLSMLSHVLAPEQKRKYSLTSFHEYLDHTKRALHASCSPFVFDDQTTEMSSHCVFLAVHYSKE